MNFVARIIRKNLGQLIAVVILFLIFPALLLLAAIVRLTSGSPVFQSVVFPLKDGARPNVYKFRCVGAVGNFLQNQNLDDLPILWAVVQGKVGLMDLCKRSPGPFNK